MKFKDYMHQGFIYGDAEQRGMRVCVISERHRRELCVSRDQISPAGGRHARGRKQARTGISSAQASVKGGVCKIRIRRYI